MTHCRRTPPTSDAVESDACRHVANPNIIDCPLGDGLALFDSRSGEYFSLNGTAALMWRAARTPATRTELFATLRRTPGAPDSDTDLTGDMDVALREFVAMGLFLPVAVPAAERAG